MAIDSPARRPVPAVSSLPGLSVGTEPICRDYARLDSLTWWRGRHITYGAFCAQVFALSLRLPSRGAVLNLCDDRAAFALAWAAALVRGVTTVLPSDRTRSAIVHAATERSASCILLDHSPSEETRDVAPVLSVGYEADDISTPGGLPAIPADQVAAILYTSGSTGKSLASVKRWGQLVSGALALGSMIGSTHRQSRCVIGAIAPQHMFGLETTVMLPFQWGAAIRPERPLLPADLSDVLACATHPAWLMMTPLHAAAYLASEPQSSSARPQGSISSTIPLPPVTAAALEKAWNAPVWEIYGTTETGMIGLRRTATSTEWQLAEDLQMKVSEDQAVIWGRADMPQHVLNDRLQPIAKDRFALLGRNSDLVKVGGKRASLADLNALLAGVKGVRDSIVVLPEEGGRLVALVVAEDGLTAREIRSQLARHIDPVFLPRPLWLVDRLPRNDNGKLPRNDLLEFIARLRARM